MIIVIKAKREESFKYRKWQKEIFHREDIKMAELLARIDK